MATKKKTEKAPEEQAPEACEVSLEELLGVLINIMNANTSMLKELLDRIPAPTKPNLS